ncbi:hypothetical protein D3C85_1591410 [compost metagenome]
MLSNLTICCSSLMPITGVLCHCGSRTWSTKRRRVCRPLPFSPTMQKYSTRVVKRASLFIWPITMLALLTVREKAAATSALMAPSVRA